MKLNEEQIKLLSSIGELYARIKMGQFDELTWRCLDFRLPSDEYCSRRDKAEWYLFQARKYIYPELVGRGHSYGIGKFKDADLAFDIHQVIRYLFGDCRSPFSYYELPVVKKTDMYEIILTDEQREVAKKACKFYIDVRGGNLGAVAEICGSDSGNGIVFLSKAGDEYGNNNYTEDVDIANWLYANF